jgi:hypothetical protein
MHRSVPHRERRTQAAATPAVIRGTRGQASGVWPMPGRNPLCSAQLLSLFSTGWVALLCPGVHAGLEEGDGRGCPILNYRQGASGVHDDANQRTVAARSPATLENFQFLEKISRFDQVRRGSCTPAG